MNIKRVNFLINITVICGLLILNYILFYPAVNKGVPGRDSGVFLYIAQQIREGQTPYLQLWDHKPPLVYLVDVLGLTIGSGQIWGVHLIELLFSSISIICAFIFIRKIFGFLPAFLSTIIWQLMFYRLLEGGNLTEEYGVMFQFVMITLLYFAISTKKLFLFFFIGLLGGFLFFLKFNLIGIIIAIFIFLFYQNLFINHASDFLKKINLLAGGFLLVSVGMFLYFYISGSFTDFISSTILYNFHYSRGAQGQLLNVSKHAFNALNHWSLFAILGYIEIYIILRNTNRLKKLSPDTILFYHFLFILAPAEILAVSASGRTYPHYYLSITPVATILIAFLLFRFTKMLKFQTDNLRFFKANLIALIALITITSIIYLNLKHTPHISILSSQNYIQPKVQITQYIRTHSTNNDYVLFWGANASYNFATGRGSPSKYFYQYPLLTRGYQNNLMIDQFTKDILINKPKFIIDDKVSDEITPDITCPKTYNNQPEGSIYYFPEEMNQAINFICQNYQKIDEVENRWIIYQRKI